MAGRKHVTLFDICRKAGVSSATVSRVINNSPLVQEQTRKRVMKAIRALGYRPSHAARMLARQRTDTIGVIFPDIASGFYAEVLSGIDSVADEANYHILTAFAHGASDTQALMARFADERRVDTAILMNVYVIPDAFLRGLARAGLPTVLLDQPAGGLPTVAIDNTGGAQQAVRHLVQLGHRRIAFICGPEGNYDAAQRHEGWRNTMLEAGLAPSPDLVYAGDYSEQSGRAAAEAMLASRKSLPDAIFSCNDAMALGILAVLREQGKRVPEDVALVGFDDVESARHLGLTSVRIPMRELGRTAAGMALALARGTKLAAQLTVMPTELMVRRSCGAGSVRRS